jgi:hypothetical protein
MTKCVSANVARLLEPAAERLRGWPSLFISDGGIAHGGDSRVANLITSLVFGLNFLEGVGRVVEHSQLTIPVRGNYLLLPTGFQGIGAS